MEFPVKNAGKPMNTYENLGISSENHDMGMGQNPGTWWTSKIAGKWMFIPIKMALIGIDPYPHIMEMSMKKAGYGPDFQRKAYSFGDVWWMLIVCFSHTGLFGIARIEFYSAIDGGFVY